MYAFVHIEKTAGTTLNTILRRSLGTRHCDIRLPLAKRRGDRRDHRVVVEAADLHRVRRLYRSMRGIAGHNVKPFGDLRRAYPEIQFFTLLRDPLARFRSHFLNRAPGHTEDAFNEWIAAEWVHNWQTKMIAGEPNAQKAIDLISKDFGFVGLTERFDESLLLLRDWLGEPSLRIDYRPVNCISDKRRPRDVARENSDMSYLKSSRAIERMQAANAADQQVYDFVTTEVYPRQVAAYRGDLETDLKWFQLQNRAAPERSEPLSGKLMRNLIYKPLLHCHLV